MGDNTTGLDPHSSCPEARAHHHGGSEGCNCGQFTPLARIHCFQLADLHTLPVSPLESAAFVSSYSALCPFTDTSPHPTSICKQLSGTQLEFDVW